MSDTHENKVIAHFADGRLAKGTTRDFFPTHARFHIENGSGESVEVRLDELKAVFFVKSFNGDAGRHPRKGLGGRHVQGKRVMVEFEDGEVLFGYTLSYSARAVGFFMFPGDPGGNNRKVFVVRSATRRVKIQPFNANGPSSFSPRS